MSFIPVNEPDLSGNEQKYVLDAVASGWVSTGSYVTRFEKEFAEFAGTRFAISTTSGTAALQLAFAALGLGPQDEVIIPALTIVATAFGVCYGGSKPVLVDSEPDTGNLDPALIERKINRRTRAIVPVHLYGHPCDMDPIREIAARYRLAVVEDAAEAHGARYRGRPAGSLGDLNCFSFYANKIVTTGEGGMITTNDEVLAERIRRMKDLCHSPQKRFIHTDVGFTLRMTNMQAALGVAQLERVDQFILHKRRMAAIYAELLSDVEGLTLPVERPEVESVYWMYAVRIGPEFGCSRDEVMRRLREKGVDTRSYFYPMHVQPVFLQMGLFGGESYPVAERLSAEGMYLPSGLTLKRCQQERVAEALRDVQREVRA